jgi:hypothetical protein
LNLHLKNLIEPMLLYKPKATIGSSMTDLSVQFGVPPKPATNFPVHKNQYTKRN